MRPAPLVALLTLLLGCPEQQPEPEPEPTPEPTPDPGPDCADRLGLAEECPALDCAEVLEGDTTAEDGDYWIDAGSLDEVMVVSCDMSTDDGGWIQLAVLDSEGVTVATRSDDNPWNKCADDGTLHFLAAPDEDEVTPDFSGSAFFEAEPSYGHPDGGDPYTARQLSALRAHVGELHTSGRMVAMVGDDDGGDVQGGGGGGLEVYALTADGDWFLLTPGSGGDCGGADGWPSSGSQSSWYLWSTDAAISQVDGDVGDPEPELGGLPAGAVLPVAVELGVFTGGGVAWGYSVPVIRVR